MESRDLVSVSRHESRDPFLWVSVSQVSGLVSVSNATGLETLNSAKKWCSIISIFRLFLFVVFADKKQAKQVGKIQEIWKNSTLRWWRFSKNSPKRRNFEVSRLGLCLEFQVSSLGIFDEVSVSKFWPGRGLDYITGH